MVTRIRGGNGLASFPRFFWSALVATSGTSGQQGVLGSPQYIVQVPVYTTTTLWTPGPLPPSAQLPALLLWTPAAAAHSPHHHFPLLLLHARVDDDDGQFVLFSAIKQVLRTNERRTDGRTDAETDVCHTLPIFYSNSVQNLAMLLLLTYLSQPASIWRWRRREENITFHKLFMSIAATGKHMRPAPVLIHFVNTQVQYLQLYSQSNINLINFSIEIFRFHITSSCSIKSHLEKITFYMQHSTTDSSFQS